MKNSRLVTKTVNIQGSNTTQRIFDYYNDEGKYTVTINRGKTMLNIQRPNKGSIGIPLNSIFNRTATLLKELPDDVSNFVYDVVNVLLQQDEFILYTNYPMRYAFHSLNGKYTVTQLEDDDICISLPQINFTGKEEDLETLIDFINLVEDRGQFSKFLLQMRSEKGYTVKDRD